MVRPRRLRHRAAARPGIRQPGNWARRGRTRGRRDQAGRRCAGCRWTCRRRRPELGIPDHSPAISLTARTGRSRQQDLPGSRASAAARPRCRLALSTTQNTPRAESSSPRASPPGAGVQVQDPARLDREAGSRGKIHEPTCHGLTAPADSHHRQTDPDTDAPMPRERPPRGRSPSPARRCQRTASVTWTLPLAGECPAGRDLVIAQALGSMQHDLDPDYIPLGCIPTLGRLQMAAQTLGLAVRWMPRAPATEKIRSSRRAGRLSLRKPHSADSWALAVAVPPEPPGL